MQYSHSRTVGDLEPLVGDEGLCRCCNGIQDMDEDEVHEERSKNEKSLDLDLPSVAEVTKGMLDLTGRGEETKSDMEKDNVDAVVKDVIDDELTKILKQTTHHLESLAAITDGENKEAEQGTLGQEEEITVNITEEAIMEDVDDDVKHDVQVQVVDEKKDNNMDTIQGLQHEIDKLLAPLTSMTDSSRSMSSSRDSLVDDHFRSGGPFGSYQRSGRDSTEIVTSAIIESNNNSSNSMSMGVKKRALRHSSSEEERDQDGSSNCRGATPKKVSKKDSLVVDFDTITVAEVMEIENVYYNNQKNEEKQAEVEEEECDDEEYEYEYYDEEEEEEEENKAVGKESEKVEDDLKATYKGETSPKKKEEDNTLLLSPREKWGLKKKSGEGEEDPLSRMEVRRALHRAGLDPSLINRPSVSTIKEEEKEEKSSAVSESEKEYKESWRTRYLEPASSYGATKSVLLSPKIKEARDQMLGMGFTDDEGWLTQLLTMKKGDIGEVLEVLSPVESSSSSPSSTLLTSSKSRTTSVPSIASPLSAPSRICGKNKWSSFS